MSGKKSLHIIYHWIFICQFPIQLIQFVSMTIIIYLSYPNKFKIPNNSIAIPITAHLQNTKKIPPRKQTVPRILFFWAKNVNVRWTPIVNGIPAKNKIYNKVKHSIVLFSISFSSTSEPKKNKRLHCQWPIIQHQKAWKHPST